MHLIPPNLDSTLGDLVEKNQSDDLRHVLAARCDRCNHGRRLQLSALVDLFGAAMSLRRLESEIVCPECNLIGGQILDLFVISWSD